MKLTWALMDFGADMTACQEALNDCMKDKGLPYEIEFVDIPIKYEGDHQVYVNSYIEKIKAGEYDIVNCMGIVGCYDIYEIAIEEGILSPFGDFLEKEEMGKELKQAYPTVVWESLKYGGDIYGVLTPYTDFKFYAVFNLDYVEKYKVDLSKITFDNMESILQKVKEGEANLGNNNLVVSALWPWILAGSYEYSPCELVHIDTESGTPIAENILYNDAYLERIHLLNDWGSRGLLPTDGGKYVDCVAKGDFFVMGTYSYSKNAAENKFRNSFMIPSDIRLQAVEVPEFENVFYGNGAKNGINALSEKKEAAKTVLAAIYSDRELADALIYGKEGKDYTMQNGIAIRQSEHSMLGLLIGSVLGNPFITSPADMDSQSKCEELWETVEDLRPSVQLGVRFDMEIIGNQVSHINTLYFEQYNESFYGGSADWETDLKKLREETKALGIEEVVSEINRQLRQRE